MLTSRRHIPLTRWRRSWYRPQNHLGLLFCLVVLHHAEILGSSMTKVGWKSLLDEMGRRSEYNFVRRIVYQKLPTASSDLGFV